MDKVELKDETAILPNPCYVQCGDNLELLKSQPNESVNMIYCDILYGTFCFIVNQMITVLIQMMLE
jgi:hypothetical protein